VSAFCPQSAQYFEVSGALQLRHLCMEAVFIQMYKKPILILKTRMGKIAMKKKNSLVN
jgi:hypothetical protein